MLSVEASKVINPNLVNRRWLRTGWELLSAGVIVTLGAWHAFSLRWLSDDAFASFRYARNWARGLGLVFNAHERVEGITNPLWTLGLGVLSRCGLEIQDMAIGIGIAAYIGCALCLLRTCDFAKERERDSLVPVGALLVVSDPDWATFATGGLETSVFSLSILSSYLLAWEVKDLRKAGGLAGLAAAITGMLRPDGALFVLPLAFAFWGNRRKGLVSYLAVSLPLLGAFHVWRHNYYGSWLPNTYYAKSALVSWWSQGLVYLGYFALRHAAVLGLTSVLSLAVLFSAVANRRANRPSLARSVSHPLVVAWTMMLVYVLSVVRVGGDFMYARLLVPVLPLLALAFQKSLGSVLCTRPLVYSSVGGIVAVVTFVWPCPVDTDIVAHHGIVDERAYYQSGFADTIDYLANHLSQCIRGYPVRAAIYGGELRLAYSAQIPYAIEAHAGLTDPVIAHKPIGSRQRVGHEKSADASYLVLTKKAHFATSPLYGILSDKNGFIPNVHADLCGVDVRLLHWDPAFVSFVRARGAQVPEFTKWLDAVLMRVDSMPDSWVRAQFDAVQHFYFAHNADPAREQVFLRRLGQVP